MAEKLLCEKGKKFMAVFRRYRESTKLQVSFAKEPYKRDNILQKKPII